MHCDRIGQRLRPHLLHSLLRVVSPRIAARQLQARIDYLAGRLVREILADPDGLFAAEREALWIEHVQLTNMRDGIA